MWVHHNESDQPPRIHNLVYLLKQTKVELTDEQLDFFLMFNDFQLEGRYPDYQRKIYRNCTRSISEELLNKANQHRLWLLSKLP